MTLFRALLLVVMLVQSLGIARESRAEEVDLELVLAIDGSGSVSEPEFLLQLAGTANAFADPSIQQAILGGPTGRIAVAVLVWADAAFPKFQTGWYVLDSEQSISNFAGIVAGFNKHTGRKFGIGGGGTGIGDGVAFALNMLDTNAHNGLRRVIDVSGDGIETDPWFQKAIVMPQAREMARARNVMINGLAILTDFPKLDEYYRDEVISGPGSFVIPADDFADFAAAIREKLWREISIRISMGEESGAKAGQLARNTKSTNE